MSKKFCWTDKAVQYAFKKIEAYSGYVFAESELTHLSGEGFSFLKELKLLKWKQFDWEHELFVSHFPGEVGTVRYLKQKKNGMYWAYPQEDDDKGRIEVSENDLPHWQFDVSALLAEIKKANKLSKKSDAVSPRGFYIGEHDTVDRKVSVYLGLFDEDQQSEAEILRLKAGSKHRLLLCPTFEISSQEVISKLEHQFVKIASFSDALNSGFVIDFDIIKMPEEVKVGFAIPEITKSETSGYKSYQYKRKDVVEFTNEEGGNRSYVVKINDRSVAIPYSELLLLIFLADRLKGGIGGWVHSDDIAKENITNNNTTHLHGLVSELKKKFAPHLEAGDGELIENIKGKGEYRISTHPSRVKSPSTRWLKQKYKILKADVLKEREKRVKQKEAASIG